MYHRKLFRFWFQLLPCTLMSSDSTGLYLQANEVAASVSISPAEAERSVPWLCLACGIFTVATGKCGEVFTSLACFYALTLC